MTWEVPAWVPSALWCACRSTSAHWGSPPSAQRWLWPAARRLTSSLPADPAEPYWAPGSGNQGTKAWKLLLWWIIRWVQWWDPRWIIRFLLHSYTSFMFHKQEHSVAEQEKLPDRDASVWHIQQREKERGSRTDLWWIYSTVSTWHAHLWKEMKQTDSGGNMPKKKKSPQKTDSTSWFPQKLREVLWTRFDHFVPDGTEGRKKAEWVKRGGF